jgi:hypothetical protein
VHRTFEVAGNQLGIRTNSEQFGEWLDRTLAAYAVTAEIDSYYYSVRVPDGERKSLGRRYNTLYEGCVALVRSLSMPVVGTSLLNELALVEATIRTDAIYVDAGVAEANGVAVLLASGLMRWLGQHPKQAQRAGVRLSAQFGVAIDPESRTVRSIGLRDRVSGSGTDELATLPSSTGAFDRLSLDQPVPIGAACEYDWQDELVVPASRASVLRSFASKAQNLPAAPNRVLEGLAAFLAGVEAVSIDSKDPRRAFEAIASVTGNLNG